jgi:hypothetical protein
MCKKSVHGIKVLLGRDFVAIMGAANIGRSEILRAFRGLKGHAMHVALFSPTKKEQIRRGPVLFAVVLFSYNNSSPTQQSQYVPFLSLSLSSLYVTGTDCLCKLIESIRRQPYNYSHHSPNINY